MGLQKGEAESERSTIVFRCVQLHLPLEGILSPLAPLHQPSLPSPPLQVPSFCFKREKGPPVKPLLHIEDVRSFIRTKLRFPNPEPDHSSSSTRKVHTGVFGIGTMGFSGSDGGYVHLSSPQANEHQGEISSLPFREENHGFSQDQIQNGNEQDTDYGYGNSDAHPYNLYSKNVPHAYVQPVHDETALSLDNHAPCHLGAAPFLDIDDVRYTLASFLHHTGLQRRSTTSLANKLPWHVPRAPFLARGLEWPPDSFESEEAKKAYYKRARKRKPFLLGSPPLWTVTAFNLAFFQMLMYNPVARFFDFLMKLP